MRLKLPDDDAEDTLWRKLTLPEEDRRQYAKPHSWTGCSRWFRSPNDRIRRVLFGIAV
jgi:hypothetical protein